ncbi:polysaccharide deacetylase family protein [Nodosilinea sp. LEGE 06152]|uniref:polysaccharide deacetylase family protein n=1 Tax=Nodosilinea sp. LEGE 06152 TaxID=2777966 RepID=UPI0018805342|nr:polysaccharide deacetylase family protein [Nodosilinea sp. LEGE 06152]MBE9159165.1 polysaccharide deacetylase family protein [Nodosilinea sp. LEGE 06152]
MALPQQQILTQVARMFPDALFYAPTEAQLVALTIDDVPTPGDRNDTSTRLILTALDRYNRTAAHPVRATFFVITDHLNPGSTILQEILASGHEIANHGTTDTTPAILQPAQFARHFQEAHDRITDLIQQPLRWYRPGRGLYNRAMVDHIRLTPGYESLVALASMVPFDTLRPLSKPTLNTWYLARFIFPGAIFVMHGGSMERCVQTAQALPTLLSLIDRQGFRVVTLSQLYDGLSSNSPGPDGPTQGPAENPTAETLAAPPLPHPHPPPEPPNRPPA